MNKNRIKDKGYQVSNGCSLTYFHIVVRLLSDQEIAFIEGVFGKSLIELYEIEKTS